MEEKIIQATKRTVIGKQVRGLRRQGLLPGVLYGRHTESTPIQMDAHTTTLALKGASKSTLFTIDLDGVKCAAILREKQKHPVRGEIKHVDFLAVSLTEKMHNKIGLELEGEAPAVKNLSAVVVQGLNELELNAFPQDMPEVIKVDVSALENIGDAIYVKDLKLGASIDILTDAEEMIALVTNAAAEEVSEEEAESSDEAEPDVIEKGKKEDEEDEA